MLTTLNECNISVSKKWYAVYTRSRTEKKVYLKLLEDNIDAFLPMHKTLQQWSDRKKMIEKPLFCSYVFVNVLPAEYDKVLQINGVVRYITFEGKAVSIPKNQIDKIKLLVDSNSEVEIVESSFRKGQKVKVAMGPLEGLKGELFSCGGKKRFLVRLDKIDQNLLVNIPSSYLEKEY